MKPLSLPKVRFTAADLDAASTKWGCNCGPTALAAICDLMPDDVRPFLGAFRGLMNPTEMAEAIVRLGCTLTRLPHERLYVPGTYRGRFGAEYGVTRIQYGGPWTNPGVNPRWAYRYTHWIASIVVDGQGYFFDCNYGWMEIGEFLTNMKSDAAEVQRGNATWWPTHIYEIDVPSTSTAAA